MALPSFSRSNSFSLASTSSNSAPFDVGRQGLGVQLGHLVMGGALGHAEEAQGFGAQGVHQQAGGDVGVVRLALDQGARGHHQGGVDVLRRRRRRGSLGPRSISAPSTSARPSQASLMMVFRRPMSSGDRLPSARVMRMLGCGWATRWRRRRSCARRGLRGRSRSRGRPSARRRASGQFDLVLDLFDVDGAAGRHAALEGGGDLLGQAAHGVMDMTRRRRCRLPRRGTPW